MGEFTVSGDGVTLAGEEAGEGTPVVLLHGLTATRRYVVMGSRALERAGHRVVLYDARGHGRSSPAPEAAATPRPADPPRDADGTTTADPPRDADGTTTADARRDADVPGGYDYAALAGDLGAVLDDRGIDRAVLAGASMGAHTLLAFALAHPDRVAGLVLVTPAFDPESGTGDLARWDRLSKGLREGGVDGFVDAYDLPSVPERFRDTVERVLRQRLAAHEHPDAIADALRSVPRSRPFDAWQDLHDLPDVPTIVVASRDEADPEHPLATGERYAAEIAGAERRTEDEGSSPLAWQGGQLSRVIAEVADRAG